MLRMNLEVGQVPLHHVRVNFALFKFDYLSFQLRKNCFDFLFSANALVDLGQNLLSAMALQVVVATCIEGIAEMPLPMDVSRAR